MYIRERNSSNDIYSIQMFWTDDTPIANHLYQMRKDQIIVPRFRVYARHV